MRKLAATTHQRGNTMKHVIIAALLLSITTLAQAAPDFTPPGLDKGNVSNDNRDTNLNSNANLNTQGQQQAQGQAQGQAQAATAVSGAAAGAISGSVSEGSSATGGNASSGGNSITNTEANTTSVNTDYPKQTAGAASLMIQACQVGVSAQGPSGGISGASDSAQCSALRQAAVHLETYDKLFALAAASTDGGATALYERANAELALYQKYLDMADEAIDRTHDTSTAGQIATSLLPVGVIGWLITLI